MPTPSPLKAQDFVNFLQFFGNFGKIICWRLVIDWRPLIQGILDPPLTSVVSFHSLLQLRCSPCFQHEISRWSFFGFCEVMKNTNAYFQIVMFLARTVAVSYIGPVCKNGKIWHFCHGSLPRQTEKREY